MSTIVQPIAAPAQSFALALVGRGIGASRSPRIHEAEARALGVAATYRLVDFDALGLGDERLPEMLNWLAGIGYAGTNVTHPFKQPVAGLCDELSPQAELLGSVNTIAFRGGRLVGENTDWIGFGWLLEARIGGVTGQRVAQVGTGGAGVATALALAHHGAAEVVLFDPARDRAEALAARLAPHFPATRFAVAPDAARAIRDAHGVVNATPVGMTGHPGVPFDPALMAPSQWLADIIYFPLLTQLVGAARANGQKTANGVAMVIGQAAEAFRLFTGLAPDRDRMLAALEADIAREAEGAAA